MKDNDIKDEVYDMVARASMAHNSLKNFASDMLSFMADNDIDLAKQFLDEYPNRLSDSIKGAERAVHFYEAGDSLSGLSDYYFFKDEPDDVFSNSLCGLTRIAEQVYTACSSDNVKLSDYSDYSAIKKAVDPERYKRESKDILIDMGYKEEDIKHLD